MKRERKLKPSIVVDVDGKKERKCLFGQFARTKNSALVRGYFQAPSSLHFQPRNLYNHSIASRLNLRQATRKLPLHRMNQQAEVCRARSLVITKDRHSLDARQVSTFQEVSMSQSRMIPYAFPAFSAALMSSPLVEVSRRRRHQ
jgi:hypothetical protein